MRNQDKYDTDTIKELLYKSGYKLIDNYIDAKTKMLCMDKDGYYIYIVLSNFLCRNGVGRRFDKSNDYSIYNINHFLKINNIHFKCISEKYCSANDILVFKCLLCGDIVKTPWRNVNKNDNKNRNHVICNNCDGKTESVHALVLKQMFMHYYPDSSIEDKSFVNPITNKICPTDIVNHKMKLAIEIQSQWHDLPDIQKKDKMKKDFWINSGYDFYSPDIRDYSVLEICKLFFDINDIPFWVNYSYSNKINIKIAQNLLNSGMSVIEVADNMHVDKHRIYDAIYSKKLYYPSNYKYNKNIKKEYILQESSETAGCA